jgi:hypothetical protein
VILGRRAREGAETLRRAWLAVDVRLRKEADWGEVRYRGWQFERLAMLPDSADVSFGCIHQNLELAHLLAPLPMYLR